MIVNSGAGSYSLRFLSLSITNKYVFFTLICIPHQAARFAFHTRPCYLERQSFIRLAFFLSEQVHVGGACDVSFSSQHCSAKFFRDDTSRIVTCCVHVSDHIYNVNFSACFKCLDLEFRHMIVRCVWFTKEVCSCHSHKQHTVRLALTVTTQLVDSTPSHHNFTNWLKILNTSEHEILGVNTCHFLFSLNRDHYLFWTIFQCKIMLFLKVKHTTSAKKCIVLIRFHTLNQNFMIIARFYNF